MNANIADDVLAPGFGAGRIEPVTMTQTNRGVQRNAHGFQRGLGRPDQDPFRRHQEALRRELRRVGRDGFALPMRHRLLQGRFVKP